MLLITEEGRDGYSMLSYCRNNRRKKKVECVVRLVNKL